jgi:acetyl esterase/lipase
MTGNPVDSNDAGGPETGSGRGALAGAALEARLHPDHAAILAMFPPDLFSLDDIPAARSLLSSLTVGMQVNPAAEMSDHELTTRDGQPLLVRVYRPKGMSGESLPFLFWIHGGGYVLGSVALNDDLCANWAVELGIAVCSVDYRLAPEHPYPTPLDGCEDAARWVLDNQESLAVDGNRFAVGGSSAGGGLAAALTKRLSDSGHQARLQLLIYPMLDDREATPSSQRISDTRVWSTQANEIGWRSYLGDRYGSDSLGGDAAPARYSVADLAGLPPAYLPVGDMDLFVDEDTAYANALRDAGVAVELHVFPGAFHASNLLAPDNDLSRRWAAEERAALRSALLD